MPAKIDLNSRFWKTFLTLLAVFLIFAGPTYVVYALTNVLNMEYMLSMVSGGILFIIGLVLLWYLVKNKVIS